MCVLARNDVPSPCSGSASEMSLLRFGVSFYTGEIDSGVGHDGDAINNVGVANCSIVLSFPRTATH